MLLASDGLYSHTGLEILQEVIKATYILEKDSNIFYYFSASVVVKARAESRVTSS